jgi:hypothetical protein
MPKCIILECLLLKMPDLRHNEQRYVTICICRMVSTKTEKEIYAQKTYLLKSRDIVNSEGRDI